MHLLHNKTPNNLHITTINQSLILYTKHEFNTSTFTTQIIASTLTNIYSSITGTINTLSNPKHGNTNKATIKIIQHYQSTNTTKQNIITHITNKEIIINFDHPIYTISDPQNIAIKTITKKLCKANNNMNLFTMSEHIKQIIWHEKKIFPNLN